MPLAQGICVGGMWCGVVCACVCVCAFLVHSPPPFSLSRPLDLSSLSLDLSPLCVLTVLLASLFMQLCERARA